MGNYWIKLYQEIIDDSKMALLPDRLWRRVIELFLLAGEYGDDGQLPDTKQLAWKLRMQPSELQPDLEQIASIGIINEIDNGWYIPKFSSRQAPANGTERVKKYRETKQKQQYNDIGNENVTKRYNVVTQITDTDTEPETEPDNSRSRGLIFSLYEAELGIITPMIKDQMLEYADMPADWLRKAFDQAAAANVRKWAYVAAILKKWKTEGKMTINKNEPRKQEVSYNL